MSEPSAASYAIEVENLVKSYRDGKRTTPVLKGVSFRVGAGETVAIAGASGAGKSTLLHCIGGLDLVDSGTVRVNGRSLANLSEQARGELRNKELGFVYQFHHLLPEFTAQENVAMPLLIARRPREEAMARAAEMLAGIGLGERLDHLPSELSGGERQRTAIARALVASPSCVLADEPTGNLDQETAFSVWERFFEAARERRTAIVIVTHDMELAGRCDRILRLRNGRIEADS